MSARYKEDVHPEKVPKEMAKTFLYKLSHNQIAIFFSEIGKFNDPNATHWTEKTTYHIASSAHLSAEGFNFLIVLGEAAKKEQKRQFYERIKGG